MCGIDLEVTTQRLTSIRATHAIRAERHELLAGDETGDLFGDDLHEVGGGDDRTVGVLQQFGHDRCTRVGVGVQTVPTLGSEAVLA